MRDDKIAILEDTLAIINRGYYSMSDGRLFGLKLSKTEMERVIVILPEELEKLRMYAESGALLHERSETETRCVFSCENEDTLEAARRLAAGHRDGCEAGAKEGSDKNESPRKLLVLDFADPVHPGGGVRKGALAQEEELCRRTSLLLSLESKAAHRYYEYNRKLDTNMGSDGIIILPNVEIFKGLDGKTLEESTVISVITCAAPMVRNGFEGMTESEYRQLMYHRIEGIFLCASYFGYKNLLLGAFGCGAFGNDANLVSDIFYRVINEANLGGGTAADVFESIDFAVMSRSADRYNYNQFAKRFGSGGPVDANRNSGIDGTSDDNSDSEITDYNRCLPCDGVYTINWKKDTMFHDKDGVGIPLARGQSKTMNIRQMVDFYGIPENEAQIATEVLGGWSDAFENIFLKINDPEIIEAVCAEIESDLIKEVRELSCGVIALLERDGLLDRLSEPLFIAVDYILDVDNDIIVCTDTNVREIIHGSVCRKTLTQVDGLLDAYGLYYGGDMRMKWNKFIDMGFHKPDDFKTIVKATFRRFIGEELTNREFIVRE